MKKWGDNWLDAWDTTPGRIFLISGVYIVVALALDNVVWIFIGVGAEDNLEKTIRFWALGAVTVILEATGKPDNTGDPALKLDRPLNFYERVLLYVLVLPFLCAFSILFFGACGAALIMTGIEAIRDFAF